MSGNKIIASNMLTDRYDRTHNYLRLSITNNCNFACSYCRPDNKACDTSGPLMSVDEIIQLAESFCNLGVNKIRLTGGEPLVHPQFGAIIRGLKELPAEIAITTNGYLLDKYFKRLQKNGIKKLNISLDTLRKGRFEGITQRNAFEKVYNNILNGIKLGFEIKLNAVIMRGVNNDELIDFALLTKKYPISVRFIEFMPFRDNNWNFGKAFSQQEMMDVLSKNFLLTPKENSGSHTTDFYSIKGFQGNIGFISTLSHPFCESCNRVRITADGKIKNCLFGTSEINLIETIRKGGNPALKIQEALASKSLKHGGKNPTNISKDELSEGRNMFSIGG